ncbi:translation initiation factor IF-2, mitochondrial isoform X1 [Petromyzon marinus]|uniref:translation initiation factor IF-2, mitochondrial isoform X1 n=2 Tax=Petromyzon marinus TaxID=7757 RepID=UPI003F70142E
MVASSAARCFAKMNVRARLIKCAWTTGVVQAHRAPAWCCMQPHPQPSCFPSGYRHKATTEAWKSNENISKINVAKHDNRKKKSETQVVMIRQQMRVSELAKAMNKDIDHVYEALLHRDDLNVERMKPSTFLNEAVIKDVIKKSGMKYMSEKIKVEKIRENKDAVKRPPADASALVPRPPIITIMGHVDHGKTTLLDSLRHTQVAAGEEGGITQHIGAFHVPLPSGDYITFLDTPGHAAFSNIRMRGALVTDIVVLVVAADDGVMEQTIESIKYAKAARVPILVAVNKCDKPGVDPQHVKHELLAHEVVCEELGGDVQVVHVSALKGENLAALTEAIMAQAEVMELKADPAGLVEGTIIEASTNKGKGPVATVMVHRGTLRRGCVLVSGLSWARVRGTFDERGRPVAAATPSIAVEVVGWKTLPSAGDEVLEVESEARAKEVVEWRTEKERLERQEADGEAIRARQEDDREAYVRLREDLSSLSRRKQKAAKALAYKQGEQQEAAGRALEGASPRLSLVVKGDVDGSVESILNVLDSYDCNDEVKMDVLHFGIGDVSEKDILLAETFSGTVYGFGVNANKVVMQLAEKKNVPVKLHKIIYRLVDDLKAELNSKLPLLTEEVVVGSATVLAKFDVTVGKNQVPVAGCRIKKGRFDRNFNFKIVRNNYDTIWQGKLSSLKHHKDDVQEVKTGMECGVMMDDDDADFQIGDSIVCYEEQKVLQQIQWKPPGF